MAYFNKAGEASAKPFARLVPPSSLNIPEITRPSVSSNDESVTSAVSTQPAEEMIPRDEPCFISGIFNFTNQKAHIINAVRQSRLKKTSVEDSLKELGIVSAGFVLESAENLMMLQMSHHTALDLYAFIAITCSDATLKNMINLFQTDNERRQTEMNSSNKDPGRSEKMVGTAKTDPRYQLVVLHPAHFLPQKSGKYLLRYNNHNDKHTLYEIFNGLLRESIDGPFYPILHGPGRTDHADFNPLLMVLNAHIKFRRYPRSETPLPEAVQNAMALTAELAALIYWKCVAKPGSKGQKTKNPERQPEGPKLKKARLQK